MKFFNASTPVATRISLLQNGWQFPKAFLEPTPFQPRRAPRYSKATNVTPTQVTVTYDILLGTTPALKNQVGTAVYQDGTWRVGYGSFCGLLSQETGGKGMPTTSTSTSVPSARSSS